jgi:hypothetical protein
MEQQTFLEVEKLFTDELYRKAAQQRTEITSINFCCEEQDETETDIIHMANLIRQIPAYANLSFRDIFIVLIYIYYSLRLTEQIDDWWLNTNFLQLNLYNKDLGQNLYYNIVTGDILMPDGTNLSSRIRRYVLGPAGGNKKIKKSRKYKLKKSRKYNLKKSRKYKLKKSRKYKKY